MDRAHRKGQVVRRREGIRFPLARGRGGRLRPLLLAARRRHHAQGRNQGRVRHPSGPQGRAGPPGAPARRPGVGLAEPSRCPAQEARGHGRDRRGPDPAARGRRGRLPPRAPPGAPTAKPTAKLLRAWPTSSSSSRPRRGPTHAPGPAEQHERGPQTISTASAEAEAELSPHERHRDPDEPADHPGQLQRVSERANAVPVAFGHVALDGRVQRRACPSPGPRLP